MAKCLYCDSDGDTREHVVPAAFGEFRDAPELRVVVRSFGSEWLGSSFNSWLDGGKGCSRKTISRTYVSG
jgi:hypothetical protein